MALPENPKITRRAVIATIDGDKASILWEDARARPFRHQHHFMVSPVFDGSNNNFSNGNHNHNNDVDDTEVEVNLNQLIPLLDFEQDSAFPLTQGSGKIDKSEVVNWKDRGDQLLKLGDAAAALPFYEWAFYLTSVAASIGSSIMVKKQGFVQVAEVDCVNDDKTLDVVWKSSGEDATIPQSTVLLTVLEPDSESLQERILLNLTRCLIQVAELSPKYRSDFARAAVLASTLAHSTAEFHDGESSDRVIMALLLRSQAQATLQKFNHAQQDLQRILKRVPNHRQAKQMLRQVQLRQKNSQKIDKTLAKEVSKWVEATTHNNSQSASSRRSKYDKSGETTGRASRTGEGQQGARQTSGLDFWSCFTCAGLE